MQALSKLLHLPLEVSDMFTPRTVWIIIVFLRFPSLCNGQDMLTMESSAPWLLTVSSTETGADGGSKGWSLCHPDPTPTWSGGALSQLHSLPPPFPLYLQSASETQSNSTLEQLHGQSQKIKTSPRIQAFCSEGHSRTMPTLSKLSLPSQRVSTERINSEKVARTSAQELHRAQQPTFLTSSKDLPLWNTLTCVGFFVVVLFFFLLFNPFHWIDDFHIWGKNNHFNLWKSNNRHYTVLLVWSLWMTAEWRQEATALHSTSLPLKKFFYCSKRHIIWNILLLPYLTVQFSGTKYTDVVV